MESYFGYFSALTLLLVAACPSTKRGGHSAAPPLAMESAASESGDTPSTEEIEDFFADLGAAHLLTDLLDSPRGKTNIVKEAVLRYAADGIVHSDVSRTLYTIDYPIRRMACVEHGASLLLCSEAIEGKASCWVPVRPNGAARDRFDVDGRPDVIFELGDFFYVVITDIATEQRTFARVDRKKKFWYPRRITRDEFKAMEERVRGLPVPWQFQKMLPGCPVPVRLSPKREPATLKSKYGVWVGGQGCGTAQQVLAQVQHDIVAVAACEPKGAGLLYYAVSSEHGGAE